MLDCRLKCRNLLKAGLIPDFQAVRPEAALGPLTGPVCRAVAGAVALGPLYRLNQFRLLHIPRRNTEILGLVLYLAHCHWSFNYFYRSHVILLLTVWLFEFNLYLRGPFQVPVFRKHVCLHSYFGCFARSHYQLYNK